MRTSWRNSMTKLQKWLCGKGIHRWKKSHDTGVNVYYECSRCQERCVEFKYLGFQAVDEAWLNHEDKND
jgi:hypothetical protein